MLSQLNPGGAEFNIPYAFLVLGKLDASVLSSALSEVIRRHEVLRTVFLQRAGKVVQTVQPARHVAIPVVDLTDYGEEERKLKAANLTEEHAARPFDLSQGPLMRAELLKLSAEQHIFLVTFHHVVYDAWSDGVFFRELDQLYGEFLAGRPSALEALTHQYSDYAAWQREWGESQCLPELLEYWTGQLDGISPQHLPTDYPRPVVSSGVLGRRVRVIDPGLRAALRRLVDAEGMTDFIVLLAAFNLLLHAYLGQDDIYVCSPIANRSRNETHRLIGYFVNIVIYRTVLSGGITFRDLMARVCKVSSGAYGHQEMPIQELINRLGLLNLPLSQVMFSVQTAARHAPSLGGLSVTPLDERRGVAFDMFLEIEEIEEALTINLRYRTDLFADETMEQLVQDYERILKAITLDADRPLSELFRLEPEQLDAWRNRRALQEMQAAQGLAAAHGHVSPRDELERKLVRIWQEILERETVGVTDNFFELGGKSFSAIRMILEIERTMGRELPVSILAGAQTIEQIAALMRDDSIKPSSTPVVTLQPRGSNPPLFLLQPAASTPLHFADLARYLAPGQPVYGFEQRGMDGIEQPHQSVEEMARFYVREMKLIAPTGPYLLLGRCMGGIVAYEMALQLQAEGEQVAFLGILDTQSPPRLEPRDLRYYVTEAVKRVIHYARQGELLEATVGRYLRKSRRRQSDDKSERTQQRVMDTHARARRRYIPARLFEGALLVFKNKEASLDAQQQWSRLATRGLEYLETSGNHETMLEEPYIHEFVRELTAAIAVRLRRDEGGSSERKAG